MKELRFIEGELPAGFRPDVEPFLFNEPAHRRLQSGQKWISYHLVREKEKKSLASIHFHVLRTLAQSPFKAPFGSLEVSKKLPQKEIFDFLQQIERSLRKHGVKKIQIKNPPQSYQPGISAMVEVMLLNSGYHILQAEINTSLEVDEVSLEEKMETWELRKWKQGEKAKLAFRRIAISKVEEVYEFIQHCRRERQQSLSMSAEEIISAVKNCPQCFHLFGVYQKEELMAASIAVQVNKRILYNFYSAHPRKFDTWSPVVSLVAGMYDWCRKQKIELLDLGTSAWDGKPNFGLLDFKLHLGGIPSAKLTFEKDLA